MVLALRSSLDSNRPSVRTCRVLRMRRESDGNGTGPSQISQDHEENHEKRSSIKILDCV
jgi:hypothetical protein